jgi:O-antigen ligase
MAAFSIYLLFITSYFLHLPSRFQFLGALRLDFLLMAVLFFAMLLKAFSGQTRQNEIGKKLLIFIGYSILVIPFVRWPGSAISNLLESFTKVVFFFFFTFYLVDSERKLKLLLVVFLGIQYFRIVEPLFLHVTQGYWGDVAYSMTSGGLSSLDRLSGAPYDVINPNQLAWVINNTIPFLYFLCWKRGGMGKLFTVLSFPVLLYTMMLTGSRSGFLTLMFLIAVIILFEGKNPKKSLAFIAILVPVFVVLTSVISPELRERYYSLFDSSATGGDTVDGRIRGMKRNLAYAQARILVGHGFGTSRETNFNVGGKSDQISHNLYIEIIQEVGIIGLGLFLAYIYAIYKSCARSRELLKGTGDETLLIPLTYALQVWILMDMFYSFSCFGLSSWEWYLFGGLGAVCLMLATERAASVPIETEGVSLAPPVLNPATRAWSSRAAID